jgi:hypothetical protein
MRLKNMNLCFDLANWMISMKKNVSKYLYITYMIFDDKVTLVYNKYLYTVFIIGGGT